jgi:hypothetical protein
MIAEWTSFSRLCQNSIFLLSYRAVQQRAANLPAWGSLGFRSLLSRQNAGYAFGGLCYRDYTRS